WFTADVAAPAPPRRRERTAAPRRRQQGRRLTGGIAWISAFAALLAGVVAMNVAVLRVNMTLNDLNHKQLQLQNENQDLASQVSSANSSLLIEQTAHRLGLVPAPAVNSRIRLLLLCIFAVFAVLLTRATWLATVRAASLSKLAQQQTKATIVLPAGRGTIFDAVGTPLALGEPATTVFADPLLVRRPRAEARAAARVLHLK